MFLSMAELELKINELDLLKEQPSRILNFVAGYKVFPQAVQCVDYFWGFLFLANFQTRSENL